MEPDQKSPAQAPPDLSRRFAEELVSRAGVGIGVWDADLRFVSVNQSLADINGLPADGHVGRHIFEVVPHLAEQLGPVLERVRVTGEAVLNTRMVERAPDHLDQQRSWNVDFYPLIIDGAVAGYGTVVLEVTERVESARALDEQGIQIYEQVVQNLAAAKLALELGDDPALVQDKVSTALTNAKAIIATQLSEQLIRHAGGGEDVTAPSAKSHERGAITVLVCDDDAVIRKLVKTALDRDDYFNVVAEAINGKESVGIAEEVKPDLVVLDLNMPVMGGLDALPELRRVSPSSSVVIMSAIDSGTGAEEALARGASAYVEKGTSIVDLVDELKRATGHGG